MKCEFYRDTVVSILAETREEIYYVVYALWYGHIVTFTVTPAWE
jgi:hypothetical protein